MAIIEWRDEAFLLDMPVMDDTHIEFVELVNLADEADDREFARRFIKLIEHTRRHFEQEEQLMAESGFPAITEHCDEHRRILGEFDQFRKRVDRGLVAFGRNYIRGRLAEWFPLHAATMDSALAAHLKSVSTMHV